MIDQSEEAKDACRFWQRIGAASKEGRPVGTIKGVPIYEVDELPPETSREGGDANIPLTIVGHAVDRELDGPETKSPPTTLSD